MEISARQKGKRGPGSPNLPLPEGEAAQRSVCTVPGAGSVPWGLGGRAADNRNKVLSPLLSLPSGQQFSALDAHFLTSFWTVSGPTVGVFYSGNQERKAARLLDSVFKGTGQPLRILVPRGAAQLCSPERGRASRSNLLRNDRQETRSAHSRRFSQERQVCHTVMSEGLESERGSPEGLLK